MTVVFTIFTGITIYFVYYNWSFIKNKVFCIKSNTHKKNNNLINPIINGIIERNKY